MNAGDETTSPEQGELEALEELSEDLASQAEEIEHALAEFIRGHPSFADRVELYNGRPGHSEPLVRSDDLRVGVEGAESPGFKTEWRAAAAFGYKMALRDAVTALERESDALDDGDE